MQPGKNLVPNPLAINRAWAVLLTSIRCRYPSCAWTIHPSSLRRDLVHSRRLGHGPVVPPTLDSLSRDLQDESL